MSNTLEITLAEKQILHAWIDDSELFSDNEDIFITEIAIEFQYILSELKDAGLSFLPEHILKKSIEFVTDKAIQSIIDTNYQKEKVEVYLKELSVNRELLKIENEVLLGLTKEFERKGPKDLEKISALSHNLVEILEGIETGKDKPLTFYDALEIHEDTLVQRSNSTKQHTGCYLLDRILPHVVSGVAVVAGYSGSMKSTYIHYLLKQRLVKRLPTIMINTELAFSGFMDSVIPSMIKEPYYDILGISEDEDMIDFSGILEKYDRLMDKYIDLDVLRIWPKSSCSIYDLERFIIYSRKKMKLDKKTTLFALVDLMSMMKDFSQDDGKTKADTIEEGVNILNEISLKTNTLLIGTVQLKRNDPVRKIEREEDIEKFRPTLASIKSSGAWEERSRFVMLLHNPYHIVHKTPCNEIIKSLIDPIVEVTMAKDTYIGKTGETIKYYFNAETKSLTPYEDSNDDDDDSSSHQ